MSVTSSSTEVAVPLKKWDVVKVTVASVLGTMFDFYDFFAAGLAAAVVWPTVFFPKSDPAAGVLLSLMTVGMGYVARPVGSIIFGHFGDRKLGRLKTMVWTLTWMGIGTAGIALTPSYASIGIAGAFLILIFRLIQGIGAGGEWGGAATLVAEYAKESRHRAFWVSWVSQGQSLATTLASGVWAALLVAMPNAQFMDWGWRVPFYIGLIILVFGIIMRYSIMESPLFKQFIAKGAVAKYPSLELLTKHWKRVLALSLIPLPTLVYSTNFVTTVSTPFSMALGVPAAWTLASAAMANTIGLILVAILAYFTDIIGRKRSLLISMILPLTFAFPYMAMLMTGNLMITMVATIIFLCGGRLVDGAFPAVLAEQYPTKFRYSGASLSYSISAMCGNGLFPVLVTYVLQITGGPRLGWPYAAGLLTVASVLTLVAILALKKLEIFTED